MAKGPRRAKQADGRFAYEGLDRVLHERGRLGVLTALAIHKRGLLFADLKEYCRLTDGNLSRHLKVLQEAGLVEMWKGGPEARAQTLVRLSKLGRERFVAYVSVLEAVVEDAMAAREAKPASDDLPGSWVVT